MCFVKKCQLFCGHLQNWNRFIAAEELNLEGRKETFLMVCRVSYEKTKTMWELLGHIKKTEEKAKLERKFRSMKKCQIGRPTYESSVYSQRFFSSKLNQSQPISLGFESNP